MDARGFVVPQGHGPVWNMAPGRSATLKLQSGETGESVTMFEEVAPAGTVTNFHLHRDSDEVAYVLSGEITFKIGDDLQNRRPGHCRWDRHLRLPTPRGRTCLEEHRSRNRARAFHFYPSGGREGV
jgi:hypothetical protein